MKKKVAIINQRYGAEVNGGSEYYTKKLAEHLQEYYDIEVLTTTALDYDTWKPYYQEGKQVVDGVPVRRFHVKKTRNPYFFRVVNKVLCTFPIFGRFLEPLWLKVQGPYCPDIIKYIHAKREEFDVFIFVTYLYYTTAYGMLEVANKSILVPTAHDEYCIYFHIYQKVFKNPRGIVYLTDEEKTFVERLFSNGDIPHSIAGSGVDVRFVDNKDDFKKRHGISGEYIIYVGRVDSSKCCDKLFDYFSAYKKKHSEDLKLVVLGKMMMQIPQKDDIVCFGFVSEEEKYSAMSGAKALIMSSEYESLSLAVLESLALGVPIVVNGKSEVLKGHCLKSGAGLWFRNEDEFEQCLLYVLKDKDSEKMKNLGIKYVKENYSWENTIEKYKNLIEG